jgi:hypothetical protein
MGAESRPAAALRPIGAYGLRLENVERARPLLAPAAPSWPLLRIRRRIGVGGATHEWVTQDAATLKLQNGGEISIDRTRGEATFILPHRVGTAEIVHPLLAPVAAIMAYWLDRQSFHAGAFVAYGKVWGIVGERGAGKSTTVARLALDGVPIVCDDMLILDGLQALVGPRSVDLRGGAAAKLGVGKHIGVVGARERWRLPVPQLPGELTLGGWIFLAWGDRVQALPVRGSERLVRLAASRGARLPPRNPDALLELAALPAWELTRPRRWSSLTEGVACLLDTVA